MSDRIKRSETPVKWSDLSFERFWKSGGAVVAFDRNNSVGCASCSSSKEVILGIVKAKKPGRSYAASSMDKYLVRERWDILGT